MAPKFSRTRDVPAGILDRAVERQGTFVGEDAVDPHPWGRAC